MKSMKQFKYVYDNNIQIIKRKIFFSQTVSNILNQKRYSKKELVEEKNTFICISNRNKLGKG